MVLFLLTPVEIYQNTPIHCAIALRQITVELKAILQARARHRNSTNFPVQCHQGPLISTVHIHPTQPLIGTAHRRIIPLGVVRQSSARLAQVQELWIFQSLVALRGSRTMKRRGNLRGHRLLEPVISNPGTQRKGRNLTLKRSRVRSSVHDTADRSMITIRKDRPRYAHLKIQT